MEQVEVTKILKALSDANRIQILKILSNGEKCACNLLEAFDITQPTLSHHMKILSECEIVNTRKEGKWSHYSINLDKYESFKKFIDELI